ncbi:hypothetical protein FQB35_01010 [Crassaminicella thermophila]|uniref:Uncharacterized protein n=1 Tax=Crassaminicella thermophila TaxID=2599308 RepID=A0A5C0SAU3_CRATE|nr:hypothetical protein [Crassaminicella thermophila]QEK11057.1 hypothetical protein FQB35_01010 [Crassaminicella thermophila]
MEYLKRLREKRDNLMDKYIMFVQRPNLTKQEIEDKKRINREIINLDFEIERIKMKLQTN